METRDIVVIGASAGGMEALCRIVQCLPGDLPASVFVVQHVGDRSRLGEVLNRCGPLKVITPEEGAPIQRGCVYVAPSNHHLLLKDGHMQLSRGPRENRHRPSVDVLFRSAARHFRARVVAVVLSGALDDGAAGAVAVKARKGLVIVQNDALVSEMPNAVNRAVDADYCLPLAEIAPLLTELVVQKAPQIKAPRPPRDPLLPVPGSKGKAAVPLSFTCPDCNGPMYQVKQGNVSQYRCLIGHLYSPEGLSEAHHEALERALLTSVRMLRERTVIHQTLVNRAPKTDLISRPRFQEVAETSARDAALLQEILEHI